MKNYNVILLLILFTVLGNIIYFYPNMNYSPIPSQWDASSGFGRNYIINNGEIFSQSSSLTWQSDIKNYAYFDVLPKILAAMISLMSGNTNTLASERFHHVFPWVGIAFLPIIIIYFYSYVSKKNNNFSTTDILVLTLFAMFPLNSTLISMSLGAAAANSVARVLFLLNLILLLIMFDEKKTNKNRVFIYLILLFSLFHYHHTWSYYAIIYLVLIGVITVLTKEKYTTGLSLTAIIIFITTAMYYNYNLLEESARILMRFPDIIDNFPSVSHTAQVSPELLGYQSFGSMYSYLQTINALPLLLLYVIFILIYVKNAKNETPKLYEKMLFYYAITYFFIILGLFIWNGITGVLSRIFECLTYLSMLFSAYLLTKHTGKFKIAIQFILLFTVFITLLGSITFPSELNMQLTNEEFIGIEFAGTHIPNKSYIFSDFRISTPLIYFDKLAIVTIDSSHNLPNETEEMLVRCYYNVSEPDKILDKLIKADTYYFIASQHQTKVLLRDSTLKGFRKASVEFQKDWSKQNKFNKIYSSDLIDIFVRKDEGNQI